MYRKSIPEEELVSLSACIRKLLEGSAYFEYRQHELKQAPTVTMMKQAQQLWLLVTELNRELENNNANAAKKKLLQLEAALNKIKQKTSTHLHPIVQKAQEIADLSQELLKQAQLLGRKAA